VSLAVQAALKVVELQTSQHHHQQQQPAASPKSCQHFCKSKQQVSLAASTFMAAAAAAGGYQCLSIAAAPIIALRATIHCCNKQSSNLHVSSNKHRRK
jgi:hypothetical protein